MPPAPGAGGPAARRARVEGRGGRGCGSVPGGGGTWCPGSEYPYSGAGAGARRTIERMLWSDPPDEPPQELRSAQAQLRRLRWVLLVVTGLVALLLLSATHP